MHKTYLKLLKEAVLKLDDSDKGFSMIKTCSNTKCSKFEIEVSKDTKCPACGKTMHPVMRRGMGAELKDDRIEFDKTTTSTKEPLDVEQISTYQSEKHKGPAKNHRGGNRGI
jgi:hypothetical protein